MGKVLNDVRVIQKCFVVNPQGEILALRRSSADRARGGKWDLPGGGYEEGENVFAAIAREVQEEAGLTIKSAVPLYVTNKTDSTAELYFGHHVFVIAWVCRDWEGSVTISAEHEAAEWVSPADFLTYDFGSDDGFFAAATRAYLALPSSI